MKFKKLPADFKGTTRQPFVIYCEKLVEVDRLNIFLNACNAQEEKDGQG